MAYSGATQAAAPFWPSKVELTISCDNLMDMDVFSKSDPLCALYINASGSQWHELGRTEMILNCLNPKFTKKFSIDYYFETVQRLKFCVYDIDNNTYDLADDDFLGELECTLGQGHNYTLKHGFNEWSVYSSADLLSSEKNTQQWGLLQDCKGS